MRYLSYRTQPAGRASFANHHGNHQIPASDRNRRPDPGQLQRLPYGWGWAVSACKSVVYECFIGLARCVIDITISRDISHGWMVIPSLFSLPRGESREN